MASHAPVYLGEPLGKLARSADELCDDLLMHMLDCDRCLDPQDGQCIGRDGIQTQLSASGGATKGCIYTI